MNQEIEIEHLEESELPSFLFLDPQDEVGPSISSSVVLCTFILLVYIVVLVLVVCLCPSSAHVVATFFFGTVLFPLLCSVLPLVLGGNLKKNCCH